METEQVYEFGFSNLCSCMESDDFIMIEALQTGCDGICWEMSLEDFTDITSGLFEVNETMWWKVSNLGLWDGTRTYPPGYVISYGDKNYTSKIEVPIGMAPPDETYWELDPNQNLKDIMSVCLLCFSS